MKIKTLALIFLSLAMSVSLWGYSFVYNGIYYNILSGNTSVEVTYGNTMSNSYSGSVTIPSSVSYSGRTYSVTSIGSSAFNECTGLTSVTLPNSVTSIGNFAFSGCTGLTSVTLPNSVTSIGNSAFYYCTGLTSVTLPNSVTSIDGAFGGCTSITAPIYNNTIFAYMPTSYSGSYTIPSGITTIADRAFSGCTGLTSVTLPNSVTSIADFAFYNCTGLTSVTLPNSVTSIGNYAFRGCTGLTSVTLPNSVTSIGDYAFYGCRGITAPIYNNTIFAYMPTSYSGSYTIPSGITTIACGAFYNCTGLTSVTLPNSVTSIGDYAFDGCRGITAPIYNNTIFAYMPTSYSGSYTIPSGITTIAGAAFDGCTGLTSVTLPNSVTSIGDAAFDGCTGLTSVTLPNSVTSIGSSAFEDCTGLTSVTLPNSVTSIGNYAFYGCTGLTSVTLPNSVTSIGNYAFRGCTGLTSVTIPNSVTSIGNYAFRACTGMTSVTLPNSVTSIGQSAFEDCTGLTSVTLPNSVTSIGDRAFYNCTGITVPLYNNTIFAYMPTSYSGSYTIPSGITTIAGGAFYECTGLTSVTLPNSVTSIDNYAFSGCTGLTSVYFKRATPPTIGSDCFYSVNPTYYVPCGATSAYRTRLGASSTIVEYPVYFVTVLSSDTLLGTVTITQQPSCQQPAVIQASAIPHYHFVQWSDGHTSNPRTITVSCDTTFIAVFEGDMHTISANGLNGVVSGGGLYHYGSTATLTATADEHYHFVSWSDGNTSSTRTIIVEGDTTYIAIFEIDKHHVTATTTNGTIAGLGEYDYGATVSLTAIPDDYYCHVNWSDGDTSLVKSLVITGDVSFSADFTKCQYVITATCEHGTVTGSGTYENPDVVTLTVTPDEDYRFVKWSDDNEYNPRVFVVRNDLTVEAICEEAPVIDDVEDVQADAPAFYVVGTTVFNPSNEQLRVYSAAGKLLKSADTDIDLFGYPAGIYMIVDGRGNAIKVPVR